MNLSLKNLVILALISLSQVSHAATLVNDFSGSITGYAFTENPSSDTNYYTSTATHVPTASGLPGQVDQGYYTVNFADAQPINIGQYGRVTAFLGNFGTYDPDLERYVGGNLFGLESITGFSFHSAAKPSTTRNSSIYTYSRTKIGSTSFPSTSAFCLPRCLWMFLWILLVHFQLAWEQWRSL